MGFPDQQKSWPVPLRLYIKDSYKFTISDNTFDDLMHELAE